MSKNNNDKKGILRSKQFPPQHSKDLHWSKRKQPTHFPYDLTLSSIRSLTASSLSKQGCGKLCLTPTFCQDSFCSLLRLWIPSSTSFKLQENQKTNRGRFFFSFITWSCILKPLRFCSYPKQWAAVRTHSTSISVPPQAWVLFFTQAMWGSEWATTSFPPIISEPSPAASVQTEMHTSEMLHTRLNCNEWKIYYLMDKQEQLGLARKNAEDISSIRIPMNTTYSETLCGLLRTWLHHREEKDTESKESENPGGTHVFWSLLLMWCRRCEAHPVELALCLQEDVVWLQKKSESVNRRVAVTVSLLILVIRSILMI